ncbi:Gfo/Idh/MocA family protein [Zhongshania sp.]|uniref:Gfo/Idh/MocA family protein n=1 Tax=Zhongshania sp. TaxID=1971902 RepID=UPI00356A2BE4
MSKRLRVGIVGGNAQRGWARDAHIPALKHLKDDFELEAVSARTQTIADEAQAIFGAKRAYADSIALAQDPNIDIVSVTVKVPEHRAVVLAALNAGKHVYCEWPLGRDLAESKEMTSAIGPNSQVMIGLQGLSAPAIRQAAALVASGSLGSLKLMRVFSATAGWGAEASPNHAYLQDKRNGATLETITGGHTLAAMEALAGAYVEVDARNTTLRKHVRIQGSADVVQRSCADHMLVTGQHASGCVSTLEVAGGVIDRSFSLELVGENGWLKISGGHPGGYQVGLLNLETSFPSEPLTPLVATGLDGPPLNVAEHYMRFAKDIRSGAQSVPDFDVAMRLTQLLDTIDLAATKGQRHRL